MSAVRAMKALSLTQPWATLVAIGAKKIETRSWNTAYRGELAIHASKGMPREAIRCVTAEPFWSALSHYLAQNEMPRGAVVATARLIDVVPCDKYLRVAGISSNEQAFGDFSPGRFAWFLEDVAALPEPVPARGSLGLWEWTP